MKLITNLIALTLVSLITGCRQNDCAIYDGGHSNENQRELLPEPIFLIEMGIGAILTTYSIYKLKRDILKQIDLSEFSFRYTLQ